MNPVLVSFVSAKSMLGTSVQNQIAVVPVRIVQL